MNQDALIDQSLLAMILKCSRNDSELMKHVTYLEQLLDRMKANDESATIEFETFVKSHSQREMLAEKVAFEALDFVAEQIRELGKINKEREFTESERQLGQIVLPNVLGSVKRLFGI